LFEIAAEAIALKVLVVAPAGTVTEGGTTSSPLLLTSDTADPPVEAAPDRLIVHVLALPAARLAGLHAKLEISTGDASRLMVALFELAPKVAVRIAL
jgi:hypothetical protein